MESAVAVNEYSAEKGQAVMLYALLIPLTTLFVLGIMDYMITSIRVMEALAAADLAAHAGAQVVDVLPDGTIRSAPTASLAASAFFTRQAPPGSVLKTVDCRQRDGRPSCALTVSVQSAGFLFPKSWIRVNALGVLAYGATRADQ